MQKEFGLESNQIPLAMLRTEHRAVTPAPGQVDQVQNEITPYVFPQSVAAFLGIGMPTVPTGDAVYPVLSKKLDVRTPAEHASADETTGAFFGITYESISNPSEFFLQSRGSGAVRWNGRSTAAKPGRWFGRWTGRASDCGDQWPADDFGQPRRVGVDELCALSKPARLCPRRWSLRGRHPDIRLVVGHETYGHAAGVFRSANAGDRAALEDLMSVTGGVRVSAHVTAASGNKQNVIVRLGLARDMVAPIWEGVTLIPDEVTKAGTGEIVITAIMLYAMKILRADGFYKQQVQHA